MSKDAHGTRTHHVTENLARTHEAELGVRRRWRGSSLPRGDVAGEAERAQSARLALARMLYGGGSVR